ncbi:cupin domain-containing protein [Pelagibacterium sediminicola]|uniref:cupin domain-containing protein n=1 Tax=Pelagibacterium sediminicola TaxID=2248761 RepID=UPI000E318861|nr:cupin domain-containing protein [Pelagibacterium sediminicola]
MTASITHIFNIDAVSETPPVGVLLDDKDHGVTCTAINAQVDGRPLDDGSHFVIVKSGELVLEGSDRQPVTVRVGQACMVPSGAGWTLTSTPEISAVHVAAAGEHGAGSPVLLDPASPPAMATCDPTPASLLTSETPEQADVTVASGARGQMNAGAWSTTAYSRVPIAFPKHEIMYLLEGNLTLTEQDGSRHAFGAGDVFLAVKDTVFDWQTDGLTKIYLTFTPKAG